MRELTARTQSEGKTKGIIMVRNWMAAGLLLLLCVFAQASQAQAVFVSSPARTDMVHDARRGIIYIANGSQIRRYRISTKSFLPALTLGVSSRAMGIDISTDGSMLAVADASSSTDKLWIYKIDLNTLAKTRWLFPKDFIASRLGASTFSVVFDSEGAVLISSDADWQPLRRLKRDGTFTTFDAFDTLLADKPMLSASGDKKTIAFAEADISDGRWGLYDVPTGQLVKREGYEDGTSQFNFEIATDRFGSQFAIPTYNGTYIYDADYQLLARIGTYAGPQPIGVAYHPVENEIYFPWSETSEVKVYSSVTLQYLRSIQIGNTFENTGNVAFVSGRTRLSADGSLLMVTVPGGLRYVRMYSPLAAAGVQVAAAPDVASAIQLKGSIGNQKPLTYSVYQKPSHGTALVYGSRVSYRPVTGYHGPDRFTYKVRYGEAVVAATVDIAVD